MKSEQRELMIPVFNAVVPKWRYTSESPMGFCRVYIHSWSHPWIFYLITKIHECNLNIHTYFLIMWSLKPRILITWNCNFQNFMGEKKKKKTSWVILIPVIRTWLGQALQAAYNTYIFTVQVDRCSYYPRAPCTLVVGWVLTTFWFFRFLFCMF